MKRHTTLRICLPIIVISVGLPILATVLYAQRQVPLDPQAVFKTQVPHRSSAIGKGGTTGPTSAQPATSATFSGGAYSGGSSVSPTTTIPEAEEHIFVDPHNSANLLATISDFSRCLVTFCFNTTKWVISTDGGKTWRESFVPQDSNGSPNTSDGQSWEANSDPVVAIDKQGNVYLASLYLNASNSANGFYVNVASLSTLASGGNLLAQNVYPVLTNLSTSATITEDKEWIAVDNSNNAATTGNVYVSWSHFTSSSNDMIFFSRSLNHGQTWTAPIQISPASQNGAVQGSQVAVGPGGEVYVVYEVFFTHGRRQHFIAKSTDGGQTFTTPAAITPLFNDLSFNSSYRKNSFAALAVAPNGNVYITYSDQPNGTVGAEVEFIRSTNGGSTFSSPLVINDNSAGQQFFSAVTADGGGIIHASWFDTRNSPTDASKYDIYATYSQDGGGTFATNARVTPALIDSATASFIGDYSGIAAAAGVAHPVWTNGGFNNGQLQTTTLTVPGTAPAPLVGLSPESLTFASQTVGTTSAAQTVTLSNVGSGALSITSIGITGANSGDFNQSNNCPISPATLAASANCTINVTFAPTATGTRTAAVSVTDNASGSPQSVTLSGTGTAPAPIVSLSATSLTFASQGVGTSSPAQIVTLSNTGSAALSITSIGITGASSGDFNQSNNCPISSAALAAGAKCTLNVTFTPTATGTRTASVSIADNAAGSPQTISLTGTGTVAPNFPPGWSDTDVGSVGIAGSASYANGTFTVKASGQWIYGTADGMHFVYQPLSGDGTIVARVVSAQGSTYPEAGVMIRETLSASSTHAYVAYEPYPGPSIYYYSRASTGASTASQSSAVNGLPYWVKLVRSGSTFSGYASLDGVNWVQVGSSQTINMAQNVYIGLAVSANNNSVLVTATFDGVSVNSATAAPNYTLSASPNLTIPQGASGTSTITVTPQNGFSGSVSLSASGLPSGVTASFNPNPATATSTLTLTASSTATTGTVTVTIMGTSGSLTQTTTVNLTVNVASNSPPGWSDTDVGSVGIAGSASYANGTFTVKASGQWIYGTADGMHFVYQPLSGDGTIVARVVSAQGSTYPEAGVMIRETLSASSTHAYVAYEPYPGPSIYYYSRASTGASTASQSSAVNGLPYWVKLVRSGSTFSGYASLDGVNWVQVGSSQTINMAQNVYIGLAVSANNNSVLVTATFDGVSVN